MRRETVLKHEFVEYIPATLENGTLYVSIAYATAVHRCICGCGQEVVTPLSPTDWTLIFDGETVSLDPSIGNWGFECKSHYWIHRGRIKWAKRWSDEEIAVGRMRDRAAKVRYFQGAKRSHSAYTDREAGKTMAVMWVAGVWQSLKKWWLN